ncbi:hypothetical protein D3C73_1249210 [compost metagenome]
MTDHGNDQTVRRLGRNADVYALIGVQHPIVVIIAGVDLRVVRQGLDHGAHDEGQQGELGLIFGPVLVEVETQRLKLGQIAFLDIVDMRDAALGLLHLLGDLAPQADDARIMHRVASDERRVDRLLPIRRQIGLEIVGCDPARWPGARDSDQRYAEIQGAATG